jgi:hypothetical protein
VVCQKQMFSKYRLKFLLTVYPVLRTLFIWILGVVTGSSLLMAYNVYSQLSFNSNGAVVVYQATASHATPEGTDEIKIIAGEENSSPSLEEIITEYFGEKSDVAIAIAKAESGLDPKCHSTVDRLADGRAFSVGAFQINLTVSSIDGVDCSKAFKGRNKYAVVIDEALYEKCVYLAEDPIINIETALGKFNGRNNWTAWGAYTNGSYLRHL